MCYLKPVKNNLPAVLSLSVNCWNRLGRYTRYTRQIYEQFTRIARLLEAYADVFSNGDNDVVRTDVIEHCIPLMDGTKLIEQPPRRLGAEEN